MKKQVIALAAAGAIFASMLGGATAAQAAVTPGTITISPTTGNLTDTDFLYSLAASVPAPAGFTAASNTYVYQGGASLGSVSNKRTPAVTLYGATGLDGVTPVNLSRSFSATNDFVSNKKLGDVVGLVPGPFELRLFFFNSAFTSDLTTGAYITLPLTLSAAGVWSLPVALTPTTTALTAGAAGTTVTLTATVKVGAATTATTGNVVFKEGAATVATVPAVAGVATATLSSVSNGSHTYTAEFAGDATLAASVSGNASVGIGLLGPVDATTGPATLSPNVIVTIPNNVGTLTLSGVTSVVDLGTATLAGGTLNASGNLAAVVTDTRQTDKLPWNLTGQVGDFTAAGGKVLNGKYLGWTPTNPQTVAGTTATGSTGGPVVLPAPATAAGLKVGGSVLAAGYPDVTGTVTNAAAVLQLKAPSNTPAGNYSATLTLTLV